MGQPRWIGHLIYCAGETAKFVGDTSVSVSATLIFSAALENDSGSTGSKSIFSLCSGKSKTSEKYISTVFIARHVH